MIQHAEAKISLIPLNPPSACGLRGSIRTALKQLGYKLAI